MPTATLSWRRPSAGEGHPPGGGGGPGRLGVHRSEPAAAGRFAGAGSAAHGPHLRGQSLLVGTPASGPDAAVLRHRPLPGPARQQQASGRSPSGPAGDRGGHPDPDDGAGGQRPRGDAPGTGQRHRPRGRPAGRGH